MRYAYMFALAAAAGSAATASAQSRITVESRARAAAPVVNARSWTFGEPEHRAALGVGTGYSGTLRDTLGLLINSITRGSPAEKAGLEEGNRIASINNVSLRINAADVEDSETSAGIQRRLMRELVKAKPGDEIELKVYADGRTRTVKIRTADSDELFGRDNDVRTTSSTDRENRPALGVSLGSTGSRRDTLGVLIMSVYDSTPAAKAGLEEGNRIAAINGVNLRVAHEDAGDRSMSSIKLQRLQREVSQLKVGDNVTLKVYSNGQFRDVTMKVGRTGDLPRNATGFSFFGSGDSFNVMSLPRMAPMPAMPNMTRTYRYDMDHELRSNLEDARIRLNDLGPQLERIGPEIRMQLDRIRPDVERAMERVRVDVPRALARVRMQQTV
ncbi:MAG: hypothetical protein JWM95_2484 [Gemmatimonadetes bacterium]|nr:hypothetical protein [Gemmatimonadota bacterium]